MIVWSGKSQIDVQEEEEEEEKKGGGGGGFERMKEENE